jgi:predicted Zn-dependent peptidase
MEPSNTFLSETLHSGVEVVGQPMPGVESAALGILIGTGVRDEGDRPPGISRFSEQMMFRGTESLDARALSEQFDMLGIDYDSSSGIESTLFSAVLLGARLPRAADLMADVIRHPSFPEEALENVRVLLLQERRQREDKPIQRVFDFLRRHFFENSPLGRDVLGTEDSLEEINRGDLVQYWHERYTADNVAISVAGKFDWLPLLKQLDRLTSSWNRGAGRSGFTTLPPIASVHCIEKDTAQEHLGMAFPGVKIGDPRYYAASVLAQALGGGTNSRLHQEVREKRGLAYSAAARFDALQETGLFRLYVGTSAERAHESVEVVMHELAKLESAGISEEELRLARTKLRSALVMRSESTYARMSANLRSWWFEHRLYDLDEVKARIDAVTVEQVLDLAGDLGMTNNLTVVALGPRSKNELFGDSVSAPA